MPFNRSAIYTAVGRIGVTTDDLAGQYSSMMGTGGSEEDEALNLFVRAEEHLAADQEDVDAATLAVTEAKSLFQKLGKKDREAEAERLLIFCYLAKVDQMRYSETPSEKAGAEKVLTNAEEEAKKELERWRSEGSKKGEASMLLSIADIALDKRPSMNYEEALKSATSAKALFKEIGDKKFEAQAAMVLVMLQASRPGSEAAAIKAGKGAVTLSRNLDDRLCHAKVIHTLAQAFAAKENWTEARKRLEQALGIYQLLHRWKWEALAHTELAEWFLFVENSEEALPHAEFAKELFQRHNYGKGWQAASLDTMTRIMLTQEERKDEGLLLVTTGAAELEMNADKRTAVLGLDALTHAHLTLGSISNLSDAEQAATKALRLTKELEDPRWEACMLYNLAQVFLRLEKQTQAIETAEEAVKKLKESGDMGGEGIVMQVVLDAYMAMGQQLKAIEVAKTLAASFKEAGDKKHEASAHLTMGILYAYRENLGLAYEAAVEAQRLAEDSGDKRTEAASWNLIAQVHAAAGDSDLALEAAKKMRFRYAQASNHRWQAISLYMIAFLSDAEGKLDAAARAADDAVTCARYLQDDAFLVEMLILASRANAAWVSKVGTDAKNATPSITARSVSRQVVSLARGKPGYEPFLARAKLQIEEAVEIARQSAKSKLADALYASAFLKILTWRHRAGRDDAEEAANLYEAAGDEHMQAASYLFVAYAANSFGAKSKGQEAAAKALEIFQSLGDKDGEAEANKLMGAVGQVDAQLAQLRGGDGAAAGSGKVALDRQVAITKVKSILMDTIGDADEDIALDEPLMDSGVDSLAAVAFRNTILKEFDLPVSSSLVFDYPSTRAVAEHLVELSIEG